MCHQYHLIIVRYFCQFSITIKGSCSGYGYLIKIMVRLECLKVKAKTNEGTYLRVHVTTFSTNGSCSIFLPLHSF